MVAIGTAFALGLAGMAWVWVRRPGQRVPVMLSIGLACLVIQVVHVVEHGAQLGAWVAHPDQPPWLTPWAVAGRDWLASGGDVALGNELLHLVGNVVFLVGLVALASAASHMAGPRGRAMTAALWIQALHVVEHVALTISTAAGGVAVGVTTGFGVLAPGPALWTTRVLAHFAINLAATIATILAVRTLGPVGIPPLARRHDGRRLAPR